MKRRNSSRLHRKTGGILIVAIVFAAISALTVGSFVRLAFHELRLSNVQFYSNESLNLAEAGLDEAMHALNHDWWTGWELDGETARMSVTEMQIGRAATGEFHVLVEDRNSLDPIVTAEGRTTTASGLTTAKQIQISLRRISYFPNPLTARYTLNFMGNNARVLSYLSSVGPAGIAPERDNGDVASTWVEPGAVDLNNAHIWGRVATGGEDPDVGPHGTIRGEDSPEGENIDWDRVTRDFTSEFPVALDPPPPDAELESVTETMTLPRPSEGDIEDRPVVYATSRVNLQNRDLLIDGSVILIVRDNIDIGGSGRMQVNENSSLRLYAYERIRISGSGGMFNETRVPSNMMIFGMNTNHQEFDLGGNAEWEAGIYAPNADIDLNGGGSSGQMAGGVVGRIININGGSTFYGDEELLGFTSGFGFAMDEWEELEREDWLVMN